MKHPIPKRIASLSLALVVLFSLPQCAAKRSLKVDFFPEKKLIIDHKAEIPELTDEVPFVIYDLSLRENSLFVYVRYRAGDSLDDFELVTNGMYTKTLPPILPVFLKHKPAPGQRGKTVMQELVFDISETQKYGTDKLILRLAGYPDVIVYNFSK